MVAFSDNFNRTNGNIGSNWTTPQTGVPQIFSNTLTGPVNGAGYESYWNVNTPSGTQYGEISITMGTHESWAGMYMRAGTGTGFGLNFYGFLWNSLAGGTYSIIINVAGTQNTLATVTGVGTSGTHQLRGECNGTAIRLLVDGVQTLTATNSTHTGGVVGVFLFKNGGGSGAAIDNFAGGDLSAATEVFANITTSWGNWTTSATGATVHPATILTDWNPQSIGDDFNRANSSSLGSAWSAAGWGISTADATRLATGGDFARYLTAITNPDMWVEATIKGGLFGSDFRGVYVRGDTTGGNNSIVAFIHPNLGGVTNACRLGMNQSGSYSDLAWSNALTTSGPFTLRLEVTGTTYKVYQNATLLLTYTTSAPTGLGSYTGFNANLTNAGFDDFHCGPMPYGSGGGWAASAAGTVGATSGPATWPGTITDNWGAWTATASARRTSDWSTAATATTSGVSVNAAITTNWGSWAATSTATVNHPATVTTPWGTWAATFTATLSHSATVTTPWGTWSASATALLEHPASVTTNWGAWAATATGTRLAVASITDNWGAWAATATGIRTTPAALTTDWGAWAASATAVGTISATITTGWGTWAATATAPVEHPASTVANWGTWAATSTATVQHDASIATNWGAWTATATASTQTAASIATNWGAWTANATGTSEGQWFGTTALIGVSTQSGAFTPGTTTWSGSTAEVGTTGVSGIWTSFTPQTWVGSTAEVGVAGISGAITASGSTWVGSTAEVGVAGVSATFTGGPTTWVGTSVDIGVSGVSGTFSAGDLVWVGSLTAIGVESITGEFLSDSVSWIGSPAQVGVAGTSGLMQGGATTWSGSLASVGVRCVSGGFSSGLEGTWEGQSFDEMMFGSVAVVEWMLTPV